MPNISFPHLQAIAVEHGLSVVGVANGETLHSDMKRLAEWQEQGYSGSMTYMQRDPALLASPSRLFEQVRSVVVVGVHYDRAPRRPLPQGFGRVARYAWGRDYHTAMRDHLHAFVGKVEGAIGASVAYRVFSDSVPLLERALGRSAGLGFIGKNTMLIVPRAGSFMFLGEVLWNLDVHDLPKITVQESSVDAAGKSNCGTCSRCLDRCPTGAFVSEYTLDARRCISYLTIEKRGVLSLEERGWIGEWIFGCDVCQDVCPFNVLSIKKRAKPDLEELGEEWGVGQALSLGEVLSIRDGASFRARFAGTALMRAKREGLVRNAAVVAANTKAVALLPALEDAVTHDSSPIVRRHALWSHVSLSMEEGRSRERSVRLLERAAQDPDSGVRDEARQLRESKPSASDF